MCGRSSPLTKHCKNLVSVFKKHRGKRITPKDKNWSAGTWYVWKRINGKIIHKALKGAQTKVDAEAAEREIIRRAFNERYGIQDETTFKEFVDEKYIRYVEQNNVNIVSKKQYINILAGFFQSSALNAISPQDCRNVQSVLRKKYSASSVNLIMSTASKIFTLACQENILDRNPMQYVTRLKEPPPRDRLLSAEEKERLWVELEKDSLLSALVILATNLPLRRGQLLAITPDAIDTENGLLFTIGSKGRQARPVPLNSTALATLTRMRNEGLLPFPLKATGIRKRWVRALKRAGVENFRFHDLRKYFAAELRRKGMHTKTIQDLFGHSSPKITDIYLPTEFEAMRAAVNSLDEVQETGEIIQ